MKKRFWIKLGAFCTVFTLLFSVISPIFAAAEGLQNGLTDDEIIVTASQLEALTKASSYESEPGGASQNPEIDDYINGLRIDPDVNLKDHYVYQNMVNGKVNNVKSSDVTSDVLVTEPQRLADTQYFYESKKTQVFSAVGAQPCNEIYPGSILSFSKDNIYEGKYTNNVLRIARSSGKVHLDVPKNDFEIDNLTFNGVQPALDIKDAMYEKMGDTTRGYLIRVASATSPEQLAASLGITKGTMDQAINNEQWSAIRRGEKQMTVVSVQQIISSLTFKNDLSHPSNLFGSDVKLGDVKALADSCMLVRKVNYGRQYLLTAELNLACSPNEERIDLTDAVLQTFRGKSVTDEGKKNALNFAAFKSWEIGRISTSWSKITDGKYADSLTKFVDFLVDFKPYTNNGENQNLVPISYEATVMGGSSAKNVTLNIEASEYNYKGKKGKKVSQLQFIDHANGSNTAHRIDGWGLDLNAFNQNNKVQEKQYTILDNHNVTIDIPAYQIIYGYRFSLRNGRTHVAGVGGDAWIHSKSDSGHRLYDGWGVKITDDESDKIIARQHFLSNSKIQLEQLIRSGTDRSRVDSTVNFSGISTQNGNPLYTQCSDTGIVGWGSAESVWEYDSSFEYAGRNLHLNNISGGSGIAPYDPPIVSDLTDPEKDEKSATKKESETAYIIEGVDLISDKNDLYNAIFAVPENITIEQKQLLNQGKQQTVNLTNEILSNPAEALVDLFRKNAEGYTIGQIMAFDLTYTVDGKSTKITQLDNEIELTIAIPETLKADHRTYMIFREHNDVVEPLKTWIGDDELLHFMTDRFSHFAIAYRDGVSVNTGIESTETDLPIVIGCIFLAVAGLSVVLFIRKKEEVRE